MSIKVTKTKFKSKVPEGAVLRNSGLNNFKIVTTPDPGLSDRGAAPEGCVPFEQIKTGRCKRPYGANLPFLFCGKPTEAKSSFCEDCKEDLYQ